MLKKNDTKSPQQKKKPVSKNVKSKPVAIILAGFNKIKSKKKAKKIIEEMQEAYDGEVIYIGQNKFLKNLAGKPDFTIRN